MLKDCMKISTPIFGRKGHPKRNIHFRFFARKKNTLRKRVLEKLLKYKKIDSSKIHTVTIPDIREMLII